MVYLAALARRRGTSIPTSPNGRPFGPDGGRKPSDTDPNEVRNGNGNNEFFNLRPKGRVQALVPRGPFGSIRKGVNFQPNKQQKAAMAVANKPKPKPAPKPGSKIPSIDDFLAGDSVLADQRSQLERLMEDFRLSNLDQQGDLKEDFGLAMERMGQERGKSLENIKADYAARGMIHSGLFGGSVDEYDDAYKNRVFDLTKDRDRSLEDLLESFRQFQTNVQGQKLSAEQEAIRRHAEQFGIGLPGTPTVTSPKPAKKAPAKKAPAKKSTVKASRPGQPHLSAAQRRLRNKRKK